MAENEATDTQATVGDAAPSRTGDGGPSVVWDDSKMTTSFANVVNGTSTREEVTLFFGTNQTWNRADSKDLKVQLSDRIILTPYAAKRLWLLLGGILSQYERRFGELNLDSNPPARAPRRD